MSNVDHRPVRRGWIRDTRPSTAVVENRRQRATACGSGKCPQTVESRIRHQRIFETAGVDDCRRTNALSVRGTNLQRTVVGRSGACRTNVIREQLIRAVAQRVHRIGCRTVGDVVGESRYLSIADPPKNRSVRLQRHDHSTSVTALRTGNDDLSCWRACHHRTALERDHFAGQASYPLDTGHLDVRDCR